MTSRRSIPRALAAAGLLACRTEATTPSGIVVAAEPSSWVVDEDGAASLTLHATVTPTEAGPIAIAVVESPTLGTLTGDGAWWIYTPAPDVSGEDTFRWTATASGVTTEATATVRVLPVNDPPTAEPIVAGTDEDVPITGRLLALDVDGDPLQYALVSPPTLGSVSIGLGGGFTYTPGADATGADAFLWSATDPDGAGTGPVRVDLTVAPTDDPPTVEPLTFVGFEDTPLEGALVGADPDGDRVSYEVARSPQHGTLSLDPNQGTFRYLPDPDRYGPDSFDVVGRSRSDRSPPATVSLVVTAVNDAPLVGGETFATDEDTPLSGVLAATDPEGDPVSLAVVAPASHGRVDLEPDGSFVYTPDRDYRGPDEFEVVAADPFDRSAPGRVSIDVRSVDDPPVVATALLGTLEDTPVSGGLVALDVDGDPLLFALATPAGHGQVSIDAASGAFVYRPDRDWNGTDAFDASASDGAGGSSTATITVVVQPVNDPPLAPDVELVTPQDVPGEVSAATTDPDGDPVYYLLDQPPAHGLATVDSATGRVDFVPESGFAGVDTLSVRLTDVRASTLARIPILVRGDEDADGLADDDDVCPEVADPDQGDVNGNGLGDACDCWLEPFGPDLDPARWAGATGATPDSATSAASGWSLDLVGDGAGVQSLALPGGCSSYAWSMEVSTGTPPPGAADALRLLARADGGPWQEVASVRGTGAPTSWRAVAGDTAAFPLDGATVEWSLAVHAARSDVVFRVDELSIACDTDADGLVDCDEWALPGYDLAEADADGDGWLDADEHLAGTDPHAPDTDLDGRLDPDDDCPLVWNPFQTDADGNGIGDDCEISLVDDFPSTTIDASVWASYTGDGALTLSYARSASWSANLGGGGADLEARPLDWSSCPAVAWELWVKRGPEAPDLGDTFNLQAASGSSWTTLFTINGNSATTTGFDPYLGSSSDPAITRDDARVRFHTVGSGAGLDDYFLDDLVVGCDRDGDDLPQWSELHRYGTSDTDPDSDGDGIQDGAEVTNGTDPADPRSP